MALAAPAALARNAYVGNEGSGTVSVLNIETGAVVGGPIPVGEGSGAIAITPDGKKAYVANHLDDTVSVIDTETNQTVGGEIPVGEGPRGVAVSPDGTHVYIGNETSGTVSVIDTANDKVVDEFNPVAGARGLAVSPDGRRLYVGQNESSAIAAVDTETGVATPIAVGTNPQGIAFTPDGSKAYVANLASASVSVIDTATETVIATVPVGNSPVGVAVTPDGKLAYVVNDFSDDISVIDTETDEPVGDPIEVDEGPRGVAFSPDGSRAYVTTGFLTGHAGAVSTIDTASRTVVGASIPTGKNPLGIAIVPDQPPLASLASAGGTTGEPIQLNASASSDPDGSVARYDWNFGDGQTALDAGPTPTHTYSAPGTYKATVTLTDSEGCSTRLVFTGLTASCNGSSVARATRTVQVAKGPEPPSKPSNAFRLGKLHRDNRRGTAKLSVWVPGAGTLMLRGGSVETVKRTVGKAKSLTLTIRPKGQEMKALKRSGQLRVQVKITFHPDGGDGRTLTKKLELVRDQ